MQAVIHPTAGRGLGGGADDLRNASAAPLRFKLYVFLPKKLLPVSFQDWPVRSLAGPGKVSNDLKIVVRAAGL